MKGNNIEAIYRKLFSMYGPQGWWPLSGKYHPSDYSYPKNRIQRFEICIGAILTQNTSWKQAEKALLELEKRGALDPKKMKELDISVLKNAIKPAGYFNQKARKVKEFTDFFLSLDGRSPKREELLRIWGIGPETADSMLLYAYNMPVFVVDAYTKRVFSRLGLVQRNADYENVKRLFEANLKSDYRTYQEYHALIVEHAKKYYRKEGTECLHPQGIQ